ncbi:PKD domain-containing protein [Natronococcus sp. A-GB1]|uniref:PKD domain-containing protein n=1 Tax=Natronococcus sp. A-GB1 TaxID=3037648 RepID=UPI00241D1A6A|nr:PKD domain-containing protein [Natronococcus sp. A-GB1]MDG5761265.1 PKD domain-containing protein [Natronococcus sp. A-GB1]
MTETARRDLLRLAGASTVVFLAGCGNDDDEEEPTDDEDAEPEEETADEDWADVDEFAFDGRVEAWTGLEPEFIDGEDNPTITLIEGQEYDFRWVNADGILHNLEIRDEDDEIVDDYQSDDVEEEGEETTLEGVTATEEMTTYICAYHESTQVGDIEIETE